MSITLGSNIASLQAQRQLFKSDEKLATVFERLSSGQRINRASDDAAGLAISKSLNTDRRVFNQAIRNLNDGLSVLNIADSTIEELTGIVIRIQELAEQAANGSLSDTQRESLDAEGQDLRSEFSRISRTAEFNDINLFDGSLGDGLRLQAGYGEEGSILGSLGGSVADGTFQDPQIQTHGFQTGEVTVGDFDGDGYNDLLSANAGGQDVTLLLGNGDGTFGNVQTFSGIDGAIAIESADLNEDGRLDFLVASFTEDTALVF